MPAITLIEPQKKNKNRYSLFLDGEFFCGAESIVIAKNGLKTGMEIGAGELADIIFESEKECAFSKAANQIAKRRLTKKQITDYLFEKGFSKEVADCTVEKLCEYNFINDEEYVQYYLQFNSDGKGKIKIIFELRQKGIEEELLSRMTENLEENEEELKSLAEKYCKNLDKTLQNKAKAFRYLQSKGYENEKIYRIINALWEN